jgi:hypothetical protein
LLAGVDALAPAARPVSADVVDLEEQAEAAARERADDASRDRVLEAAESRSREAAEKKGADASEDVGVRGDFEFFLSHNLHSSFVPRAAPYAFVFLCASPHIMVARHFDAGQR